jgi:hypothetical protein
MQRIDPVTDAQIIQALTDRHQVKAAEVLAYDAAEGDRPHWLALYCTFDGKSWFFVGERHTRRHLLKLARTCPRPNILWIGKRTGLPPKAAAKS